MTGPCEDWLYLTADLPGIGGALKLTPEDFLVTETLPFELTGDGEHLYLYIEKRDTSHEQLVRDVAQALGISRGDVGTAGMKDRRAVTRQYVSVPRTCEERVPDIETGEIRVLSSKPHSRKLKTGKLKGNRFSILVRDVCDDALPRAQAIRELLGRRGFPNYFGEQRFGAEGETLQTGLDLLTGRLRPQNIPYSRRRFLLRLSLSAAQSWLFNRALADRIADGLAASVLPGDVMQVCESGGIFVCEDAVTDRQRFDAGEITVTGPLFGPKMRSPEGEPLQREQRVLESCGLTAAAFQQFRKLTSGARRAFFVRPESVDITPEPDGLRFEFALPPGTYATVLLREFRKV